MNLILTCATVCASLVAQDAGTLPDELRHLAAVAGNEARLVDAARAFDVQNAALANWDITLAESHQAAGEYDLAKAKLRQASARFELIRQAYDEVLARYPKNARANNYYGELLYDHLNEPVAAVRYWKLASYADRHLGAPRNNLALHFCHFGDYRSGLRYMEEALEVEPDNPDFLYNATQLYLNFYPQVAKRYEWPKKKVYHEAMKMSRKAAKLAEDDYELRQDYAVNFYAAENFDVDADWREAAKAWQAARLYADDDDSRFYTWLNEARVWKRAGDKKHAVACLKEALAIHPGNEVASRLLDEMRGSGT